MEPVDFPDSLPAIRHMVALREIAHRGRIKSAAELVHLSQPALTQALAGLEKRFGVVLFDRSPKGLVPTQVGGLVLGRNNRALEVLVQGERLALRIAQREASERGEKGFHRRCTGAQLRALIAVGAQGSFSQAARALGLSQPGVHRAARELEKTTGLTLFRPAQGGVALTPAAEALARHVSLAQAEVRQAHYEVSAAQGADRTHIAIGALPLVRSEILPAAVDRFLRDGSEMAQVRLLCRDGAYEKLLRDLRLGQLDFLLGALRDPPPAEDVVQEVLFQDELAVVVAPDHPLARRSNPTIQDTLAYPWVAPPHDTPSGRYLAENLGVLKSGASPVRVEASSMIFVRGLVQRGDYVTLMSRKQIQADLARGFFVVLDIALPGSARPIGLTTRRGWQPTSTQKRFVSLLRQAAAIS